MEGLCGSPHSYIVYLCAKQLKKNTTMFFFNVAYSTSGSTTSKKVLQITAISVRNIRNHVKVYICIYKKTSVTCNHKRWSEGNGLETGWDGWLIAGNTHDSLGKICDTSWSFHTVSQPNKIIFEGTKKKNKIISHPSPTSIKEREVNAVGSNFHA